MVNFMQILYRCYKELDDRFIDGALQKAKKSERVRAIVLNSMVPISKQEYSRESPGYQCKNSGTGTWTASEKRGDKKDRQLSRCQIHEGMKHSRISE